MVAMFALAVEKRPFAVKRSAAPAWPGLWCTWGMVPQRVDTAKSEARPQRFNRASRPV